MKEYYNRMWREDNPFGKWTRENFNYHLKLFKPYLGEKILDYGCGRGDFLNLLCEKGYGYDISEVAINKARQLYPKHIFSNNTKGFAAHWFDTICLIDVLEHIPDVLAELFVVKHLLKPDGHILIATNQLTRIKSLAISIFCFEGYFHPTSPHLRYFTKDTLKDVLQLAGFKIVKYQKNRTYLGIVPQGQLVIARLK